MVAPSTVSRAQIVAEAFKWEKTPYHHQASLRGVGVDCLGLLRGVYVGIYGTEPEKPPPYSPSWGEADVQELLLNAAQKYLLPTDYEGWKMGDVLIFRVKNSKSAKHCAIVVDDDRMIHAISQRGVMVTNIGVWASQVAGVFKFPGIE